MAKEKIFTEKLSTIPVTPEMKKRLHDIYKKTGISVNQLVRFGIEKILKEYEKKT